MSEPMGFTAAIATAGIVILMVTTLTVLLKVVPFWMICKKAGFPAPLALLMLIPVADIVLAFYIAFAAWPALRQRENRPVQ
jgi:hypothetical protein